MGLDTRIRALRLGFGPQDWDLGLETKYWASRLGFEGGDVEEEGGEEGENSPMCESIGHRPFRGRCPASPSTSSTTDLGRARLPPLLRLLVISSIGYFLYWLFPLHPNLSVCLSLSLLFYCTVIFFMFFYSMTSNIAPIFARNWGNYLTGLVSMKITPVLKLLPPGNGVLLYFGYFGSQFSTQIWYTFLSLAHLINS